jgi:multiple sugar transport system permease protein
MIGRIAPATLRVRRRVAAIVVVAIFLLFTWLFRRVGSAFTGKADRRRDGSRGGGWQTGRRKLAWLLLLPALLSIAVWSYYPLARGTLMAFQDYNVRGFSEWVGFDNFATVLFNAEFWHSLGVSLKYALLYMTFGFAAPIVLAFLLSEVPRGKIVFRTIYYLPAVLSGVVVIFLWKGFYGSYGMINQLLNRLLHLVNALCGTAYAEVTTNWLSSPGFALLFCLLPTIWAGMGPGCLIYLAALKTVPDDIYEAADIEGAGVWAKVRYIALPSIRTLIGINFLGAMIGAMKSGSEFILAMTGGGPYAPYGKTEVVGLHIFWEAFGYLRFGTATAMAWVLGSMLIGFTVMRLRSLSRMEFRTAGR